MNFETVKDRYVGPELERQIQLFWKREQIFEQTQNNLSGKPLYIWNEGPPTANGKPGIHHVLARTFKDLFPRFKTMRGFHCPRKAGWDTHGLPVEHEIEKELGIFDKTTIEREIGIAEFNRRCRDSVMKYISDWEDMTNRMGFWVDLEEAYYTLNRDYIESVWWLLKEIWNKDLIYQGYKVVPYDPRIGATLSSHEVAQGYKEIEDPSVYVRFPLIDPSNSQKSISFLAWTTTPWTLPSNMLLAVHRDVQYAHVEFKNETLIVANDLIDQIFGDKKVTVTQKINGSELLGLQYERPFDYLQSDANAWRVVHGDFVTTDDGTGIVHIAPAYGVDDLALGQKEGVPVVHGVGLDGRFFAEVKPVSGLLFKEADEILVNELKASGKLFYQKRFLHNYPHGWRTGDPLMYYAKNAWYIRTSAYKQRMVDLNQTINWVPQTIKSGRFGKWLENNIDWALSRERFWGTPLPVWTDGDGEYICIGSVAELEQLCGKSLDEIDLHRPSVDEITFIHPKSKKEYRRVPEVIDCWFDSGAMSYAQWHYPFENKDSISNVFPADYICEAIDQTRGWFYTLHAIATLVSDSVAYKNCICLAHIVDEHGKKMSKSQGNIINPYEVFDKVGADALRWYFTARVAPDVQKRISIGIVEDVASSFINTLWNTYKFFVLYARLDQIDITQNVPYTRRAEIDQWILSYLAQTIRMVTESLERYDALSAGQQIEAFVDALSNWYVRRNRKRFWKASSGIDQQSAYLTLYESLTTISQLCAPFMPFLSEDMYQNLVRTVNKDAPISVHLSDWPDSQNWPEDVELIDAIDVVRKVVNLGRSARNQSQIRIRKPLSRIVVRAPSQSARDAIKLHQDQITDELNVKDVQIIANDADVVTYRIKPNLPRIGRNFGKLVPDVKKALLEADGKLIAQQVARGEPFTLEVKGNILNFEAEDVLIETESAEGYVCAEEGGYLVGLDTTITPELILEGLSREIIRSVQEARKMAGLQVADRINLAVMGDDLVMDAINQYSEIICQETLAQHLNSRDFGETYSVVHEHETLTWKIMLAKV